MSQSQDGVWIIGGMTLVVSARFYECYSSAGPIATVPITPQSSVKFERDIRPHLDEAREASAKLAEGRAEEGEALALAQKATEVVLKVFEFFEQEI